VWVGVFNLEKKKHSESHKMIGQLVQKFEVLFEI
jgi:hypothetical protein